MKMGDKVRFLGLKDGDNELGGHAFEAGCKDDEDYEALDRVAKEHEGMEAIIIEIETPDEEPTYIIEFQDKRIANVFQNEITLIKE